MTLATMVFMCAPLMGGATEIPAADDLVVTAAVERVISFPFEMTAQEALDGRYLTYDKFDPSGDGEKDHYFVAAWTESGCVAAVLDPAGRVLDQTREDFDPPCGAPCIRVGNYDATPGEEALVGFTPAAASSPGEWLFVFRARHLRLLSPASEDGYPMLYGSALIDIDGDGTPEILSRQSGSDRGYVYRVQEDSLTKVMQYGDWTMVVRTDGRSNEHTFRPDVQDGAYRLRIGSTEASVPVTSASIRVGDEIIFNPSHFPLANGSAIGPLMNVDADTSIWIQLSGQPGATLIVFLEPDPH